MKKPLDEKQFFIIKKEKYSWATNYSIHDRTMYTLTNAVNALTKTIGGKKLNNKYVKGYLKSIERIARKNPGGFVKDYGEFDVSDWIEDVRYNLQNEYKK